MAILESKGYRIRRNKPCKGHGRTSVCTFIDSMDGCVQLFGDATVMLSNYS